MERDAIQKYLDFQYEPLSKRKLLRRLFAVYLLTIVCCTIGKVSHIWGCCLVFCNILITILFVFILVRGVQQKRYKYLWDGITYLYLSFVLTLTSYQVFIQNTGNNYTLLFWLLFTFVINTFLSAVLVTHNIQLNKYDSSNDTKVNLLVPYLFAIIGYVFIKKIACLNEAQMGSQILGISILIVSCIIGFGWTNLIRYILVRKQR